MIELDLTVVIVTYNSARCLEDCIASVTSVLGVVTPIIVVDNASTDDSALIARSRDQVSVVELGTNEGYGWAVNVGASYATTKHVCFMNPDVRLSTANLQQLRAALEASPLGLLVPELLGTNKGLSSHYPIYKDRAWPLEAAKLLMYPFRTPSGPPPLAAADATAGIWASAAILFVDRQELARVGGFAPEFFLYWEDRDLSRRYLAAGLPLTRTGALKAEHAGGQSSSGAGLRTRVIAWSHMGFLEYVAVNRGVAAARRAAVTLVRALRLQLWFLTAIRGVVDTRIVVRKGREVQQTLAALDDATTAADGTPERAWRQARPLLRRMRPLLKERAPAMHSSLE